MGVREQLVTAATAAVRRRGVAGAGVAEILGRSGVARRSLYLHFPGGKDELITTATQAAGRAGTETLEQVLDDPHPLRRFVELWFDLFREGDYESGCAIVAATLGRSSVPEAADEAAAVFAAWHRLFRDRLVADGVAPGTADTLTTTVIAAVEGAVVLCQAQRSSAPLDAVVDHVEELLALHVPDPAPAEHVRRGSGPRRDPR